MCFHASFLTAQSVRSLENVRCSFTELVRHQTRTAYSLRDASRPGAAAPSGGGSQKREVQQQQTFVHRDNLHRFQSGVVFVCRPKV